MYFLKALDLANKLSDHPIKIVKIDVVNEKIYLKRKIKYTAIKLK